MNTLRLKARTLLVYAGMLRFRMGTDVYQELSRLGQCLGSVEEYTMDADFAKTLTSRLLVRSRNNKCR